MYKPDYGLKLLNDGVGKNIDINFHSFPLYSLTIIAKGQYSTMVEMPFYGKLYALSLDFNQKQLDEILHQTDSDSKNVIESELLNDPSSQRTIDFESGIVFHAVARLGELESNAKESYVPLILHEIGSLRLESHKDREIIQSQNHSRETLSYSIKEIIKELEFNLNTKIELIISELINGRIGSSLKNMSYIVCGDPTSMKVYEIESFLLKEELDKLEDYQRATLWLDIEDNAQYYSIEDVYDSIDELDIFNHVYSKIDFYETSPSQREDFLKLLDRQCWLETEIEESNLFYSALENEVLSQIEYFDPLLISVPDFVTSFEEIQLCYIYGKDMENLTFNEYKKHLLYKLTYLIAKRKINQDFFSDVNMYINNFDGYYENSDFYMHLPPIYFAKKIMESEEYLFAIDKFTESAISFKNLDSSQIIEVLQDYDDDLYETINSVIETNILDAINFDSAAYNKLVYDNSEQRYDHDLSRFLQYTYNFKENKDHESRLIIYNRLQEELKDEHNTIRSLIETFLKDNFSEYETSKVVKQDLETSENIAIKENVKMTSVLPISKYIKDKAIYLKSNIKTVFKFLFWILLILTFIGYSMYNNSLNYEKEKIEKLKEEKMQQDISVSVHSSVLKFNASTDWIANLGKKEMFDNPILTYELERVWLINKPILFIGEISDIKIKNENEYLLTISRNLFINEVNFADDIELSLIAKRDTIDLFMDAHDNITHAFSFDRAVAVIANIDSVNSQRLLNENKDKHTIKIGNGEMLEIIFLGKHGNIFNN